MTLILFALLFFATSRPAQAATAPRPPVAVFADLDGTWSGNFVGYDAEGRELYRIHVRQSYRTIDERTQTVEIEDRMADGTVIRGRGTNVARRRDDGSLALTCKVEKSNGETVEHTGRVVRGPEGLEGIVWYSREENRSETFRESVRREGEHDVYSIEGMGLYDGTPILMSGRYERVAR